MDSRTPTFSELFKRARLKAGFATLSEFGKALADEGLIFEDSLFSRWQNGSRIPKDRKTLLKILKVLIDNFGITSLREANVLLESTDQGNLTESELQRLASPPKAFGRAPFPRKIVEFLMTTGISKKIPRTGWLREKIRDPESVAEHSFRLSVLAMVLAEPLGLDKEKLIKMAIMHDLGEVITGDIVVWLTGGTIDIKKQIEKEKLEKEGIGKIFRVIGKSNEYVKIFEEMIERTTQEAKIFWQLDKLEMALQALEYEKDQNKNLGEFFITADLEIHSPYLKMILREILKSRRRKILKQQILS